MSSGSNRVQVTDHCVIGKRGYTAVEVVSMPLLMTGNEIMSAPDHSGTVIMLVGGFVAYNLFRLFTS